MSGVCDGGKIVDIVRWLAVGVYCFSNRKKGRMDSDKNHETSRLVIRSARMFLRSSRRQKKSSPQMNRKKVYRMISLLKERQE